MSYGKKTVWLILLATLVRCGMAAAVELGNDEVYYRLFASDLQWNYFDHPPMVGWLIRFTTVNLFFDQELFIRLGAILSAAAATWLMFKCGEKIGNAYTGFLAACIYTVSLYGSVIAGIFILPDSPQMVMWVAGLFLLLCIVQSKTISSKKSNQLLLFGLLAGIGLLCKIHTVFLWLGFLLYILVYNRQWFLKPVLYISGAVSVLLFYPVIQWNIDNHFITFLYHGSRVNIAHSGFDLTHFAAFAVGQFLYTNPVIFVCMIVAVMAAFKNNLPILRSQKRILLLTALPLIGVAAFLSLFREVLPHWSGPAYTSLVLLTACYFTKRGKKIHSSPRMIPLSVSIAGILLLIFISAGILVIRYYPGTLGKNDNLQKGNFDFTLDMFGWNELKLKFGDIVQSDIQKGIMKKEAVIVCNKWFPAAHIEHYVAEPLRKDLVTIGPIEDIHQYAWFNKTRRELHNGDDAYCIVPSNYYADPKTLYSESFTTILPPEVILQERNGVLCRRFYIWRMLNYVEKPPPPD